MFPTFLRLSTFVLALLCIPLMAMFLNTEVNWSLADFVLAGILLYGVGLLVVFIKLKVRKRNWRIGLLAVVFMLLLLLWMELAVGLFGSPIAGS